MFHSPLVVAAAAGWGQGMQQYPHARACLRAPSVTCFEQAVVDKENHIHHQGFYASPSWIQPWCVCVHVHHTHKSLNFLRSTIKHAGQAAQVKPDAVLLLQAWSVCRLSMCGTSASQRHKSPARAGIWAPAGETTRIWAPQTTTLCYTRHACPRQCPCASWRRLQNSRCL